IRPSEVMDQSMMVWMGMQNQQQNPIQNQAQNQQSNQPWTSQFHFLHLIENLADAVEGGVRDQHSDMLVNELTLQLEKCQQSLNSIAGSNDATTVSGQKQKLEEYEKQLNHRRLAIARGTMRCGRRKGSRGKKCAEDRELRIENTIYEENKLECN
ncbi:hypothetical protein KI387_032556, partial [Taxus chinensis]